MEILVANKQITEVHKNVIIRQLNWERTGSTANPGRGLPHLVATSCLGINIPSLLQEIISKNNRNLLILEAGCGYGQTLVDLKKGVEFTGDYITDGCLHPEHEAKRRDSIGNKFPPLADKLYAIGSTLVETHASVAEQTPAPFSLDRMHVGPIQECLVPDKLDFVLDCHGSATHFPEEAIEFYGKILLHGGWAFIRQIGSVNSQLYFDSRKGHENVKERFSYRDSWARHAYFESLLALNGLEIITQSDCAYADYLVKKN